MGDALIEGLSHDYCVHPYSKRRGAFWRPAERARPVLAAEGRDGAARAA